MHLVSSTANDSHVVRYERLSRGSFFADFRRDKRLFPEVYHCIVQRAGEAQILAWTQHTTLDAARQAAEDHLQRLNHPDDRAADTPESKARAAT
ncbi:MAG TPA: hypothetical protein VF133_18985 [Terriglobales bacterium]